MSHRRPDPSQAVLEQTLIKALRLAADSIEPAADGLDRIRTKIAAGQPPRIPMPGRAVWRTRYFAGLLAALSAIGRYLKPAALRAWYVFCAVVDRVWYAFGDFMERFRPEDGGTGWTRWLRPAAALTAAFLVVTALSFAITTVPPALINIAGNNAPIASGGSDSGAPASGQSSGVNGSGVPIGQSGSPSPTASASCTAGASSASSSGSASPSQSPSPSPSSSPPPASPSPSPTPTTTTSPTPTETPSPTGSASGQASQPASSPPGSTGGQAGLAGARNITVPTNTTQNASSPHPTVSGSKAPCGA